MEATKPILRHANSRPGRIALLLLLLISPVGAPVIGILLEIPCPDALYIPDRCVIARPAVLYFMQFGIMPSRFGHAVEILWLLLSVIIAITLAWLVMRLTWTFSKKAR